MIELSPLLIPRALAIAAMVIAMPGAAAPSGSTPVANGIDPPGASYSAAIGTIERARFSGQVDQQPGGRFRGQVYLGAVFRVNLRVTRFSGVERPVRHRLVVDLIAIDSGVLVRGRRIFVLFRRFGSRLLADDWRSMNEANANCLGAGELRNLRIVAQRSADRNGLYCF